MVATVPQSDKSLAAQEKSRTAKSELLDLVKMVVVFLVVFWVVKSFIVEGYEVLGDSMSPTLHDGERILVLKLPHHMSKVDIFGWIQPFKEGDIIVFEGSGRKRYVKRIIAQNKCQRSNAVSAQPVAADPENDPNVIKVEFDRGIVRVNNWQIDESGYLSSTRTALRDRDICYLQPGEYYVLGDNRAVSKDSRNFHAITDEQIVGKAILRFWPLNKITFF